MSDQNRPQVPQSQSGVGGIINSIPFIRGFIQQMRLAWFLFRDPRVPLWTKAIPIITIIYLVSPVDWLINLIPVLGQLEDIAVLGLGMNIFIQLSPQEVVDEYRQRLLPG